MAQVALQAPAEQTWPAGHAFPHVPQFLLSDSASTHVPLHRSDVSPIHVAPHVASEQTVPEGHLMAQPPQLFGSTWTGAQKLVAPVPQTASNGGHERLASAPASREPVDASAWASASGPAVAVGDRADVGARVDLRARIDAPSVAAPVDVELPHPETVATRHARPNQQRHLDVISIPFPGAVIGRGVRLIPAPPMMKLAGS